MQVTLEIPEGPLSEEVSSWQDGARYTFGVVQTAPNQFTVETAEAAAEEEAAETEPVAPAAENPAIANVIAKGRKPVAPV